MTEEEFVNKFGIKPERCKQIMESIRQLVNSEVREAIEHSDYYINPTDYCSEEFLEEHYGKLEKDDDSDGYKMLYDFGKEHSAVETFMDVISLHTRYGGHCSAISACSLMGLEWERDL